MENADEGSLYRQIRRAEGNHFPEATILKWFADVCSTVKYLHDKRIVCGDIPCRRVLQMADGHVKTDSFAIEEVVFSKMLPVDGRDFSPLPPEVVGGKSHTAKSDIWGLGCFLYELCTFHRAFKASTLNGMLYKIVRESPSPIPPMYSDDLRDLIDSYLSKIPRKRPTIDQILNLPLLQPYLRESSLPSPV